MADFTAAIEAILKREGGYVDHAADRGKRTNYGISARRYPELDIQGLTREDAIAIYKRDFWNPLYDKISLQKIADKIFDLSINLPHGDTRPYYETDMRAVRVLQQALCDIGFACTVDGRFGAQTLQLLNLACRGHVKPLLDAWRARQARYYVDLVLGDPTQLVFLSGWLKRAVA